MSNDATTVSNTCLSAGLRTPNLKGCLKVRIAPILAAQEQAGTSELAETPTFRRCGCASPLFLAAGDRVAIEDGRLVVVRAGGVRLSPAGDWSTRCGRLVERR
ncbi:hypothetical protein [Streptomyces griseosporeus]|uniref:hypothetical protein n=1 Tax=Streptomyces griseosporeus TaxID=1910 RepID=UPI0036FA2740